MKTGRIIFFSVIVAITACGGSRQLEMKRHLSFDLQVQQLEDTFPEKHFKFKQHETQSELQLEFNLPEPGFNRYIEGINHVIYRVRFNEDGSFSYEPRSAMPQVYDDYCRPYLEKLKSGVTQAYLAENSFAPVVDIKFNLGYESR